MKRLICLVLLSLILCACATEPASTTLPPQPPETTQGTSLPPETTVPPETTLPPGTTAPVAFAPYTVRIADPYTCIYDGPALRCAVTALVDEAGAYTIVEEATDADGNLWGKLKSGLGWVCLTNPPLAPIHCDYAEETFNPYHAYWCDETDYITSLGFTAAEPLTDVRFGLLDWFETESWQMTDVAYTIDSMDPDQPFLAQVVFWGDMTTYGISFTDARGGERHYAISISGRDGSVVCTEYVPE